MQCKPVCKPIGIEPVLSLYVVCNSLFLFAGFVLFIKDAEILKYKFCKYKVELTTLSSLFQPPYNILRCLFCGGYKNR